MSESRAEVIADRIKRPKWNDTARVVVEPWPV
jgi:hypothetical protein